MQMRRYFPDYADPANYPYLFYGSSNARVNGPNTSNYRNPEMDALIAEALEKSDPSDRAESLKEATRMANRDMVIVPIFWPDSAIAIRSDYKFEGFTAFWYNTPWAIRGFGVK